MMIMMIIITIITIRPTDCVDTSEARDLTAGRAVVGRRISTPNQVKQFVPTKQSIRCSCRVAHLSNPVVTYKC